MNGLILKKITLTLMLAALCLQLSALDPAKEIFQYNQEVFLTEDGLPQSSVLSITGSSDGYLWLTTFEGLARFDGVAFHVFDVANTPVMKSNRMKVLLEDSRGDLWIGSSDGLLNMKSGAFTLYDTKEGLCGGFINALAEDVYGTLWVGSSQGLSHSRSGASSLFISLPGLKGIFISSLAIAPDGAVWAGTSGKGLWRVKNGAVTHNPPEIGLLGNEDIRVLLMDTKGGLWIGDSQQGLIYLGGNLRRVYTPADGLAGADIRALYEDRRGAVWVGSNSGGLSRIVNGVISAFSPPDGLLSRPIRSFWEDAEGSLWVGARDGLCQLLDGKFVVWNRNNGLPADAIRTVFQDSRGDVWVGAVTGGLALWRDKSWRIFDRRHGLKSDHVWSLAESNDGSLWIGAYGGGLHRMKNDRIIRVYNTESGLSNNIVRALLATRDGKIWAGTNGGGLDILNPLTNTFSHLNTASGLSDNFVYALAEDTEGAVWVGYYNGAVDCVGKNGVKAFSTRDGLPGHSIFAIRPDTGGDVWLGSDGGGLLCFKNNRFFRFTMKDGLYDDLTFQITPDLQGNLWLNGNRGLYSARKKDLMDFAAGKIPRIPCTAFGKNEGVKNTESSGPGSPASFFSADGRLWFPTIRGVVVLDPAHITVNPIPPPVIMEMVSVDDTPVYSYPGKALSPLRLLPGAHRLDFRFTGLSYISPRQMRFRYRLEGFDDTWRNAGSVRSVAYTNLPPGNYTFRVIAANADGVWNERGASFPFTLAPLFWQTVWFRLLLTIFFALASYWIIGFVRNHLRLSAFWRKKKFIGPYEIEEQIGSGGMGIIYRVHSVIDSSRVYALKVMKDELLPDKIQKKRFKNESLLVDRVDHPNSVRIFERGEDNDKLYLVMELLNGKTLAERFREDNYPAIGGVVHIMRQVADLLVALRQENIIHRDIKPENIILVEMGGDDHFVKLLDFGIARIQTLSNLTESGQVLGTLPFMPPEVLSDAELSPAVDVYSLGVLGYLMLTRREPFHGESPLETMRQILNVEPPPPVMLNQETPPSLNGLIMRMIGKDPEMRPPALEVRAELERLEQLINEVNG